MSVITQSSCVQPVQDSCLLEEVKAGSLDCSPRVLRPLLAPRPAFSHWSPTEERQRRGLVRMCWGEQAGRGALFGSTLSLPTGLSHFLWLLQVLSHSPEQSTLREGSPMQPLHSEARGSKALFRQ